MINMVLIISNIVTMVICNLAMIPYTFRPLLTMNILTIAITYQGYIDKELDIHIYHSDVSLDIILKKFLKSGKGT